MAVIESHPERHTYLMISDTSQKQVLEQLHISNMGMEKVKTPCV